MKGDCKMKFKIMGRLGDSEFIYDDETAKIKFDELLASNLLPMKVTGKGNKALTVFDPTAREIVWMPKIAGG
jgi:hypothetical protein